MGWCSGSYIAEDIWRIVEKFIPEELKKQVAMKITDRFCDEDADDWDNSGVAGIGHPEWFDEE